jgi:hypothetical protein
MACCSILHDHRVSFTNQMIDQSPLLPGCMETCTALQFSKLPASRQLTSLAPADYIVAAPFFIVQLKHPQELGRSLQLL